MQRASAGMYPKAHMTGALKAGSDRHIERLNGIYEKLLTNSGADIFEGTASFTSANTIEVDGQPLSAKHFLIATGSRPQMPAIDGIEYACTSDTFFSWTERPQRVAIVGGGYIGVELAGILHGLGSEVILIHRGEKLLRGFDEDIRDKLVFAMHATGIDLSLETTVSRLLNSILNSKFI